MNCNILVLFFLIGVVYSNDIDDTSKISREAANNNPVPVTDTTTTSTKPTPSTKLPTTTKPSTTTQAPTTSITTTQSTTSMAPPVPTTTVKPHKDNFWVITDDKNNTCLITTMQIKLEVAYNNSKPALAMSTIEVPGDAIASGDCSHGDDNTQYIKLSWPQNSMSPSWIAFSFSENVSNKTASSFNHYWLSSIEASLNVDNTTFPNITDDIKQITLSNSTLENLITAPLNVSFSCSPDTHIKLKSSINESAFVTLSSLQIEAFRKSTNQNFSSAIFCDSSDVLGLVPILVGCFLIGLVIIVLVAYLITRRRSMARGYLSM